MRTLADLICTWGDYNKMDSDQTEDEVAILTRMKDFPENFKLNESFTRMLMEDRKPKKTKVLQKKKSHSLPKMPSGYRLYVMDMEEFSQALRLDDEFRDRYTTIQ